MKTAILDTRGLLLNLYHSGKDKDALMGDDGKPYNTAGYGIDRFIQWVISGAIDESEIYPRATLACWDSDNSRRKNIFEGYKDKRKAGDVDKDPVAITEENRLMTLGKSLLASLGYMQIQAPSCEADDLIAFLCEKIPGYKEVRTIDADLLALSSENVLVSLRGEPIVGEYKEVPLELISVEKSIVGDKSDCYPGIKGMGPAAFQKLLEKYGVDGMQELEQCVASSDFSMIEEALAEEDFAPLRKLYNNKEDWTTMYLLARLHPEWIGKPFGKKLCNITYFKRVPNAIRLKKVLEEANCMHHFEALSELCPTSWIIDADEFEGEADYEEAVEAFSEGPIVAFDFESYDPVQQESLKIASGNSDFVDSLRQVPVGASFCFGANYENCFYVTTGHSKSANLPNEVIGKFMKAADESEATLVAHHSAYEIELAERECNYSPEKVLDTIIMIAYADENLRTSLKFLSKELLGYDQQTYAETIGDKGNMSELTAEEAAFPYGCDDSIVTAHMFDYIKLIMLIEGTWDFYEENQPDAERVLIEAKREGTPLDEKALATYAKDKLKESKKALKKLIPLLDKHCKSPNTEAVDDFIKVEIKPYLMAKNNDKEDEDKLDRDELRGLLAKERVKLLETCIFTPPEEHIVSAIDKWLPTVKGFKDVCNIIGIQSPESVAVSKLSDYLEEQYESMPEDLMDVPDDVTEFMRLLGPAASELKARDGEHYNSLKSFCAKLIDEKALADGTAKVIKTGTQIEVGSPKKMQQILYCMLGLPVRRHSKITDFRSFRARKSLKGSPGTDVLAMDTAKAYDLVKDDWRWKALDYMRIIKQEKTYNGLYFSKYPNWIYESDGNLHPSIKNCGTVTRRPSGGTPNLLQVSGWKDEYRLRSCFPAIHIKDTESEPHVVVAIDWSQQELRIMASECEDETMMNCYIGEEERDIHSQSSVGIIHKVNKISMTYDEFVAYSDDPESEHHKLCNKTRKVKGKPTNFLIGYGGAAPTLAENLIITMDEANLILDAVFETYPGIKPWQKRVARFAKSHGYTQTAFGNRRHADAKLFSSNRSTVSRAERQLINAQIQGCAADILVKVLGEVRRAKLFSRTKAKMIAPVYDELVSRVPISKLITYTSELSEMMSLTPPGHKVPMAADISLGSTWGNQNELGILPSEEAIMIAAEESMRG